MILIIFIQQHNRHYLHINRFAFGDPPAGGQKAVVPTASG